jgi:hypothetical protein
MTLSATIPRPRFVIVRFVSGSASPAAHSIVTSIAVATMIVAGAATMIAEGGVTTTVVGATMKTMAGVATPTTASTAMMLATLA